MSTRGSEAWLAVTVLTLAALSCQFFQGGAVEPTPEAIEPTAMQAAPEPTPEPDEAQPSAVPASPEPTEAVIEDGGDDIIISSGDATSEAEPDDHPPSLDLENGYQDPAGFYSIDYPASWFEQDFSRGIHLWADEDGQIGLTVSPLVEYASPEAIIDYYSNGFYQAFYGYEELGREDIELSNLPAVWVDMQYELEGDPVRGFMAAVVRDRAGYVLIGFAPEDDYPEQEPTLRAMVNSLSLTDFEDAPLYDEWETYDTELIQFHYLPDTYVASDIEAIAEAHTQALANINDRLGVSFDTMQVQIYFYPDQQALHLATARDSSFALNAAAYDVAEVHTIWTAADDHQTVGHELTHVVVYWTLGEAAQALLGEGIAVCLDSGDTPVHDRARALLVTSQLLPLANLVGDTWFDQDPEVAYPESGSVACYLLDKSDPADFQWILLRDDFEDALSEIYGVDLDTFEADWLSMLENGG